jgi:hypothetical protein
MARIDSDTAITLTGFGRKTVEDMRGSGMGFTILSILHDSGGMSVNDLQRQLPRVDRGRLLMYVKRLGSRGYIQPIGNMRDIQE